VVSHARVPSDGQKTPYGTQTQGSSSIASHARVLSTKSDTPSEGRKVQFTAQRAPSNSYHIGEAVHIWSASKEAWMLDGKVVDMQTASVADESLQAVGSVQVVYSEGAVSKWVAPELFSQVLRKAVLPHSKSSLGLPSHARVQSTDSDGPRLSLPQPKSSPALASHARVLSTNSDVPPNGRLSSSLSPRRRPAMAQKAANSPDGTSGSSRSPQRHGGGSLQLPVRSSGNLQTIPGSDGGQWMQSSGGLQYWIPMET
jgi:hypothetical protein